jgi:iron-sulfur cluster assembly accessory protein
MELAITPAAEKFIRRLLRFDGGPGSGLRLKVTAGGCSGLAADFSVEASPPTGDKTVEVNGIRFFMPAESRLLLEGVTIDFSDTPLNTGFVFHDPKKSGGACGSSGPVLVSLQPRMPE